MPADVDPVAGPSKTTNPQPLNSPRSLKARPRKVRVQGFGGRGLRGAR